MKFSKNPLVNGILYAVFTAAVFTLVMFVLSLIKKIPFSQQFSPMSIVICVVGSLGAGVSGYMNPKK
jgi:hypothetical protein